MLFIKKFIKDVYKIFDTPTSKCKQIILYLSDFYILLISS